MDTIVHCFCLAMSNLTHSHWNGMSYFCMCIVHSIQTHDKWLHQSNWHNYMEYAMNYVNCEKCKMSHFWSWNEMEWKQYHIYPAAHTRRHKHTYIEQAKPDKFSTSHLSQSILATTTTNNNKQNTIAHEQAFNFPEH